ncbi:MAG: SNF2-related protein, partial [Niameybacter sp.]
MMHFKPHSYQEYAIDKIIELGAVGLFMDMGMGKTVSTLTAVLQLLFDYFEVGKVLVIAPLRVADATWTDEVGKWEHLSDLKVSKVLGSQDDRLKALSKQADIYVINRENVSWLVGRYKQHWPFDMVVVDELSSFKSPKSKRFKDLKRVLPYIKRIVGLTGTPAPNSLMDLWSQLYLLDKGERLGKTLTAYREKYFSPDKRNQHIVYTYKLKSFAEEAIHKQIGDICISLSAEDYLDLPERIDNVVKVKLNDKVMQQYKEFERQNLLELQDTDITAATAGVVVGKLLQMANGNIYDDQGEVHRIHDAKLEALSEIIEHVNGQPVLVFYNFKHDYDSLVRRFKKLEPKTLQTGEDIKAWNQGKIKMLLAHPASVGHGLNLQAGGNII